MTKNIFVFGSNYAGRHGKGAAQFARKNHGAVYGIGMGLQGNSYAIPTKDEYLHTLELDTIEKHIETFLNFADEHDEMLFIVTPIGTGLAGYTVDEIKSIFQDNFNMPDNVVFTKEWFE